jgi:hypothetical protein
LWDVDKDTIVNDGKLIGKGGVGTGKASHLWNHIPPSLSTCRFRIFSFITMTSPIRWIYIQWQDCHTMEEGRGGWIWTRPRIAQVDERGWWIPTRRLVVDTYPVKQLLVYT